MMRVLIVDDHALVRAGIALLVGHQDDMEPVGQAGTAAEAIKLACDLTPDIILLDVTMPGGGGLECLPKLLAAAPDARVLMLSMHEDPNYVRAALGAGASGYVLKDAAYEELVDAIRKVAAGHAYVAPALGARLAVRPEPDAPARQRLHKNFFSQPTLQHPNCGFKLGVWEKPRSSRSGRPIDCHP